MSHPSGHGNHKQQRGRRWHCRGRGRGRRGNAFIYDAKRKCKARSKFACCLGEEGECLERGGEGRRRRLLNCILTHICSQEIVRPQARHVAAFTIHYERLASKANINVSIRGLSLTKAAVEANSEFVVNPNRELPLCLVHNGNLCCMQHASQCVSHLILTSARRKAKQLRRVNALRDEAAGVRS